MHAHTHSPLSSRRSASLSAATTPPRTCRDTRRGRGACGRGRPPPAGTSRRPPRPRACRSRPPLRPPPPPRRPGAHRAALPGRCWWGERNGGAVFDDGGVMTSSSSSSSSSLLLLLLAVTPVEVLGILVDSIVLPMNLPLLSPPPFPRPLAPSSDNLPTMRTRSSSPRKIPNGCGCACGSTAARGRPPCRPARSPSPGSTRSGCPTSRPWPSRASTSRRWAGRRRHPGRPGRSSRVAGASRAAGTLAARGRPWSLRAVGRRGTRLRGAAAKRSGEAVRRWWYAADEGGSGGSGGSGESGGSGGSGGREVAVRWTRWAALTFGSVGATRLTEVSRHDSRLRSSVSSFGLLQVCRMSTKRTVSF